MSEPLFAIVIEPGENNGRLPEEAVTVLAKLLLDVIRDEKRSVDEVSRLKIASSVSQPLAEQRSLRVAT